MKRGRPYKFGSSTVKVGVVIPRSLYESVKGSVDFSQVMVEALERKIEDKIEGEDYEKIVSHLIEYVTWCRNKYSTFTIDLGPPFGLKDLDVEPWFYARGISISRSWIKKNWIRLRTSYLQEVWRRDNHAQASR